MISEVAFALMAEIAGHVKAASKDHPGIRQGEGGRRKLACQLSGKGLYSIPCRIQEASMKTVRDLIGGQELSVVFAKQTVLEAARLMRDKRIGAAPVVDGDRLVGILSERDVMNRVVAAGLDPGKTALEEVMTRDLIIGSPDEDVRQVIRTMKQADIRHLPIVEDQKLTGIVSLRDLLMVDIDEKDEEIRMMTAYIHYVPLSYGS
jgi:CBS domain-containing protein